MSEKKRQFDIGDVYDQSIANQELSARKDTLEGIAYAVKHDGYTKILSESEITQKREQLAETCIKIDAIEAEKKDEMERFKELLKEPTADKKELLEAIKHKSELRHGGLYYIDDQENGFMYIFDENAECVESRPLRPDERQTKMRTLNTGTDGE